MTGQPWNVVGSGLGYSAPANGCKAMTTATAYPAGRGVAIMSSTAGDVVLQFADATQITVPVADATIYQFNWAITTVVSKTATATVYLLI